MKVSVLGASVMFLVAACSGGGGRQDAGCRDDGGNPIDCLSPGGDLSADGGDRPAAGDGGCAVTAADPCRVRCTTIVFEAVPDCGGVPQPARSTPASAYIPEGWWVNGGTQTDDEGTVSFDATTCIFRFSHTICSKTWLFDLKNDTCQADYYGSTDENPCWYTCPVNCHFERS